MSATVRGSGTSGWNRDLWILALGSAALFLVALGGRDLWNPNEPIYGRVTVEMWQSHNWLIPTLNDAVFAEKPILYYWLALAISFVFGGISEATLRLPSVLAGVGSVLLTYQLVLPYTDRARAFLSSVCLATMYLVWWESRAVQMDVLVLVATLGVLVPLSRMLDFEMPQAKAWALAGVAAGLGFAAKGPVAWIVPGIVFLAHVALRRMPPRQWARGLPWGALVAVLLAAPWYVLLWASGQTEVLYEVLVRQNLVRFVSAWDHVQPWYYYATYVVADYLPWSLFVPVAIGLPNRSASEKRLDSLAWTWLIGTVVFFSLADSKRAPYLLPMAPAIAILASSVLLRFGQGRLSPGRHRACLIMSGFIATIMIVAAPALVVARHRLPPEMVTAGLFMAASFALAGGLLWLLLRRSAKAPQALPRAIAAAMAIVYVAASIWILPAANVVKSARSWAHRIEAIVGPDDTLASFGFYRYRAGYPFYAGRSIPNYNTYEELTELWKQENVFLLVEDNAVEDVRRVLGDIPLVMQHSFSSRTAYLFSNRPAESD